MNTILLWLFKIYYVIVTGGGVNCCDPCSVFWVNDTSFFKFRFSEKHVKMDLSRINVSSTIKTLVVKSFNVILKWWVAFNFIEVIKCIYL